VATMILSTLTRRLLFWKKPSNQSSSDHSNKTSNSDNQKKKKQKDTNAETQGIRIEQSLSVSSTKLTTTDIDEESDRTSSDNVNNTITTTLDNVQTTIIPITVGTNNTTKTNDSIPDVITLPPPNKNVILRPDEMKFHCQVRIMAHDVKYSMVTKVLNSWENDLKVIPKWETIGGELLLRKYVLHYFVDLIMYFFCFVLSF
jgi:hypothetical protein